MATGGAWGGNRINDAFLGIWKDILRKEGYSKYYCVNYAFLAICKDILRKECYSKY